MSTASQIDDWRASGACVSADPELFFPVSAVGSSSPQIEQAREICASCPVRTPCLRFALAHPEVQGIWGGTTDAERQARRAGRPPAVTRHHAA